MKEHLSIKDIEMLLLEASRLINHTEFVVIGSLSVLGALKEPPRAMVTSVDVDLYPKNDPGRAYDLMPLLGEGSDFNRQHSYYADAVSPNLPTLPDDWEDRLIPVRFESGITAFFLSPNDTAVSKYTRGEERDRRWIRAGLEAGIVNLGSVEYHLLHTVMETAEKSLVRSRVEEDGEWMALNSSPRRLTVLQTLPALHSGGVERGTLEIARALVAAGHRSIVVSNGGRLVEQLVREGSEHITLPVHRKSLASLFQIRPFRRLLKELKPDIVHARSRIPAWIAWLALRRMSPKARPHFVTTVHGLYSISPYSAIMAKGERVIVVSETVRDYVLTHYPACDPARIKLIYRGVEPSEFPFQYQPSMTWLAQWQQDYPQLAGKQVLALPGRITRLKGHETFLTLISALRTQGLPVHGLIVGGVEEKKRAYLAELKARVAEMGLSDDISFTGLRSDIRDVFSQCQLVLSLSTQPETFGRTVLEALSLGTPVVAWEQGGVGEILRTCHPEGAVATNDSAGLEKAVIRTLQTGPCGMPVEHFRLTDMCAETLAVYSALIKPELQPPQR